MSDTIDNSNAVAVADGAVRAKPLSLFCGLTKASIKDHGVDLEGDALTMAEIDDAFGSASAEFRAYAIGQLLGVLRETPGDDCTFALKSAVAQIRGIGPRDEQEAMLAVQMVCAHHAAITLTRLCIKADRLDTLQVYGNLANKFSRTYAAQMEGLAKLRRGGEQVVKHVHVNDGGQAVIAGTVNQTGGRGSVENGGQSHGTEVLEACAVLRGPDSTRNGVSVPGDAEREMQDTRGNESGRA